MHRHDSFTTGGTENLLSFFLTFSVALYIFLLNGRASVYAFNFYFLPIGSPRVFARRQSFYFCSNLSRRNHTEANMKHLDKVIREQRADFFP